MVVALFLNTRAFILLSLTARLDKKLTDFNFTKPSFVLDIIIVVK